MTNLWASIWPEAHRVRLLVTDPKGDCLRAVLPPRPAEPFALTTLLQGLAFWYGENLHAAMVVGPHCPPSAVEDLCDERHWPFGVGPVELHLQAPRQRRPRRRIHGMGHFRDLIADHEGGR